MSYSFGMFFTPASTFANALKKAQKFAEVQGEKENIEKILEREKYYFPSMRHCSAKTENEKLFLREADSRAIDGFCTLNFVYFHKAKLLALVGWSYPQTEKYFKKHVGFQNSCDQDYERDAWKGIKLFEQIWDECANVTAEQYFDTLDETDKKFRTVEEINEKLGYYQRSLAYDRIYKELCLNDWLWGRDVDDIFTRFSFNVLSSREKHWETEQYASKCLRVWRNEEW